MAGKFVYYPTQVKVYTTDDLPIIIEFVAQGKQQHSSAFALTTKTALKLVTALNRILSNESLESIGDQEIIRH